MAPKKPPTKAQSTKNQQADPKKPVAASSNNALARVGPQHELLSQPEREEISTAATPRAQRSAESGSALVQRALRAPASLSPKAVKSLHHTTGSRAATALLNARPAATPASAPKASPSFSLQTKLEVGPAGDRYEQEADRMAASVMRQMQTAPSVKRSFSPSAQMGADAGAAAQRAPQPPLQQIRLAGEGGVGMEGGEVDSNLEQSIHKARGGGQPLAPNVRSSMEGAAVRLWPSLFDC